MVKEYTATQPRSRLAELIATTRKERGLTQMELSQALGYKRNAVSVCRWERGTTPIPHSQYVAISKALDIPLESLLHAAKADDPHNAEEFSRLRDRLSLKPAPRDPRAEVDLRPDLRAQLKRLQAQYSNASLQALHDSAIAFYAAMAEKFGLDRSLTPKAPVKAKSKKS